MEKINLHIYPSPYKFETRINKEVNSILEMRLADKIIIAGTWTSGLKEEEKQSENIQIRRIKTCLDSFSKNLTTKILSTLFFNFKTFFEFKNHKISHINCHSLWVLPLCVVLKNSTGAKLIYDAHELETERAGLYGVKQKIAKMLEKLLIKYVDNTIVVGDLIAGWYKKEYHLNNVYVIRNVPLLNTVATVKSNLLRKEFNIPDDDIIFIYQGIINKGRGIEIMIETFSKVANNKHLVVMGFGPLENKIIEATKRYANIHFMPAVKPQEIPLYTSGADVGLFMVENIGLSYYWCLPNKLFEYLYCDLPVIASDFPEIKNIIDTYNCGWTREPSIDNLIAIVNSTNKSDILSKKTRLKELQNNINWKVEAENLKNCYN